MCGVSAYSTVCSEAASCCSESTSELHLPYRRPGPRETEREGGGREGGGGRMGEMRDA